MGTRGADCGDQWTALRMVRMCGRYTFRTKLNLLLSQFAAELAEGTEWEPHYNIPPTSNVPAVRLAGGKRQLALFTSRAGPRTPKSLTA
jgi:putative SOS response-associated peptidase YedK